MRSLIVAALLGVASAADAAHCEVSQESYKTKDCTGDATKVDFSKLWGTVVDTCTKSGDATNKGSKMKVCSATKYEYLTYTDDACTDANKAAANTVKTIDGKCAEVSGDTSKKYVFVAKAEGAQGALAAAWTLVAAAMLVTQV